MKEPWRIIIWNSPDVNWVARALAELSGRSGTLIGSQYPFYELDKYDIKVHWTVVTNDPKYGIDEVNCYSEVGFMMFKLKYCK